MYGITYKIFLERQAIKYISKKRTKRDKVEKGDVVRFRASDNYSFWKINNTTKTKDGLLVQLVKKTPIEIDINGNTIYDEISRDNVKLKLRGNNNSQRRDEAMYVTSTENLSIQQPFVSSPSKFEEWQTPLRF